MRLKASLHGSTLRSVATSNCVICSPFQLVATRGNEVGEPLVAADVAEDLVRPPRDVAAVCVKCPPGLLPVRCDRLADQLAYGDLPIIDSVKVDVAAGELVAVVGPNGAGKSTLLKAILGLAKVFAGEVALDDEDIVGLPLEKLVRRGLGYVAQTNDVFGNLRVIDNLEMGGYLLESRLRDARIQQVFEIFPARAKMRRRYVRAMRGGEQKMRQSLARSCSRGEYSYSTSPPPAFPLSSPNACSRNKYGRSSITEPQSSSSSRRPKSL
jgi:ABC-type transport system involved in cytochrome c biogenesis ATPase subunit